MLLLSIDAVRPGMALGVGLRNADGHMLLGPGETLTSAYLARLQDLGYSAVWIDDEDTRDIPYEETLSERTRTAATTAIRDTFAMTVRETGGLRSVSVDAVRGLLEDRRFQQAFHDSGVVERLNESVELVVGEVVNRTVLTGLGSLYTHSTYMYHHCLDTAVMATTLGRFVGFDNKTLKQLAVGCILHDVGSLFVDADIDKPSRLTEDEFRRVKDHTMLGYLFMRDSLRVGVMAAHVAYQHHERQNGTGYPRGLTGSNKIVNGVEVHLPGRITPLAEAAAIADFHDACSSDRPYRHRIPGDVTWQMVHAAACAHLNREMVEIFLSMLPPYPLGTRVQFTEGRWRNHSGVVARVNPEAMHQPVVRVLENPDGERIAPADVDLRHEDAKVRGLVGHTTAARPVPI